MIWPSSEPIAEETADIVAESSGVALKVMVVLEEHHRGNVPFLPWEKLVNLNSQSSAKPAISLNYGVNRRVIKADQA